jgi:predicted transposase/invertase (TIGR01784 family)
VFKFVELTLINEQYIDMRIIHQPTDKFFKQSLLDQRVAKELFIKHLPLEIKSLIDFDCLNVIKNSFIDEAFKEFETDVLYQTKLINQDNPAYIYLLCEHQTSVCVFR